ncbi:MAG TPA: adenosylcobinamide-phosphate synthase CbiB [Syntrophorhabdaceae bacterium]|nr:adenosylcobinamide-phosphate synthase CbiB [Syntrophorhabdaceae bacterium]
MEIGFSPVIILIFCLAFFVDLAIGDPPSLPHPVRIIGKGISGMERLLKRSSAPKEQERLAGFMLALVITLTTFLCALLIEKWILFALKGLFRVFGIAFLVYLTATTLATKELLNSSLLVVQAVEEGHMERAREHLSMIVGRDVDALDRDGILRAAIETVSENFSDGVIAPMFFFVLGGMPLALAYKAVNTLDSMVGYKNETYRHLGWASARLDDLCNYVPARLSAILIALAAGIYFRSRQRIGASFKTLYHEGRHHTSPNSGYPEAAIAGALKVRLGGPSTYNGVLVKKPYIGSGGETDYLKAALDAITIVRYGSFGGFFISLIVLCVWWVL